MAKTFWVSPADSSAALSAYTGLSPTFTLFVNSAGTTATPPGITESPAGNGVYSFVYGPTIAIFGQIDWGVGVASSVRYTRVVLDPIAAVDERVGGILNNTDSIGNTAVDPTTVIGWLKRQQEFLEGDAVFTKSTGVWTVYDRGGTLAIAIKTLTNNSTSATKV